MGDQIIITDDKPAKPDVVIVQPEPEVVVVKPEAKKTVVTETVKVTRTE